MNLFKALMPTHHAIVESTGGGTKSRGHNPEATGQTPQFKANVVHCLVGNAQLLSIGRYDREMAITLKGLIDMLEEGDFITAQSAAEVLVQQIRTHRIEASADESGVASH